MRFSHVCYTIFYIMKKITVKEMIIIGLLIIYIFSYYGLATSVFQSTIALFNIIFWGLMGALSYLLVGYVKCRKIVKKDSIQMVIIYTISYLIIIYLLGIITGFLRTPLSHKILSIILNVLPVILIIIFKELIRYMLLNKLRNKKSYIYLITILFILVDIVTLSISYDLTNLRDIFDFSGKTILASIFRNSLLSYMVLNAGCLPAIIYSVIMEGYLYVVPIVPNLGSYLETILLIFLPTLLILELNKIYIDKEINKKRNKVSKLYFEIPGIIVLIGIMCLVSGVFRYKIFAIASNSMQPVFSRGDTVIIEKINDKKLINNGDIIAFRHEGRVLVHRVVKIRKYNNVLYYTTKGDNNNTEDNFEVAINEVEGIVQFILPIVGYPTVWLSEMLS